MSDFFEQVLVLIIIITYTKGLQGFEKTTVLPHKIRSLHIKRVTTTVTNSYNEEGSRLNLGNSLEKNITFKDILKSESGVKKNLLQGLLRDRFKLSESLGSFFADMKAKVSVVVPIISYGLTESTTIAIAVPYYAAKVGVSLGFKTSQQAEKFVSLLHDESINQTQSAKTVANKLNNAVDELNKKLISKGYHPLKEWSGKGLGDITIGLKKLFLSKQIVKLATFSAISAPTGKSHDPDILHRISFGSGTWNILNSLIVDEYVTPYLFLNQYLKHTYQLPYKKEIRLITEEETIDVPKRKLYHKPGNKIETGVSIQYETNFGLQAGFGIVQERKMQDSYEIKEKPSIKAKLEKNTKQISNHIGIKLSYSSLSAFKQNKMPVPLIAGIEYKKQLSSYNIKIKDFITLDISMFF